MGPLLLRVHPKSVLLRLGYWRSFRERRPLDAAGQPLPWWTYGCIDFLAERIRPDFRVLEFGCGYSTLWFSSRVKEVVSFETDAKWAKITNDQTGLHVTVLPIVSLAEISEKLRQQHGQFQIGIVDADIDRMECVRLTVKALSNDGVIIWDNTDWVEWPEIKKLMRESGFREISFTGIAPQEIHLSRTTIFYRDNNCLDI